MQPAMQPILADFSNEISAISFRRKIKSAGAPSSETCIALCANNIQCTRRKKNGFMFCGMHCKKPASEIKTATEPISEDLTLKTRKVEVWLQDIHGILMHIDIFGNVYDSTEILNKQPIINAIYKYGIDENGIYYIKPSVIDT